MMKTEFTKPEIDQLLELIKLRQDANRSEQKLIRNSMRKIGFYGRNCFGITDMNVEKFNSLITKGLIRVKDECHNHNSMQHNVFADDSLDTFSFAPLIDKDSEVLILGTVPGE